MENKQPTAQIPTTKKLPFYKKFSLTPKERRGWLLLLSVFVIITILGGIYLLGYERGHVAGERAGKASITKAASQLNNLKNPFNTVSGMVTEIKDDSVTVETKDKEKKTIKIDDKTRVTRKTDTLSKSDIKEGQKVTVFSRDEGDRAAATRIVLRD